MPPIVAIVSRYFADATCNHAFFFLPNWWEFLPPGRQPNPNLNCEMAFKFPDDIWAVGLSVLDILLRIGGFVAVISIIIAGVQYITSMGNTDAATNARKRLTNSLIGLAIIIIASGVVAFIGNTLGG
jgi:hypothetical protein